MLKKIQAGSGLAFLAFVTVHLLNTWAAALGPAAYDGLQALLRFVYQFAPLEALLLAALAVHVVVGVMRIVQEPKRTLSPRARWHRYAGFFLAIFISGHILAVRGASWFYGVFPGFEGLAFSVAAVPGYFYPYYFALAMAGFYHGLNGMGIALGRLGIRFAVPDSRIVPATAGAAVLTVLALLGLGGWLFDVGDVHESAFARLAMEITGVTVTP